MSFSTTVCLHSNNWSQGVQFLEEWQRQLLDSHATPSCPDDIAKIAARARLSVIAVENYFEHRRNTMSVIKRKTAAAPGPRPKLHRRVRDPEVRDQIPPGQDECFHSSAFSHWTRRGKGNTGGEEGDAAGLRFCNVYQALRLNVSCVSRSRHPRPGPGPSEPKQRRSLTIRRPSRFPRQPKRASASFMGEGPITGTHRRTISLSRMHDGHANE